MNLYLYKKDLYDSYHANIITYTDFIDMGAKIAYGRKTWAIANWFTDRSKCIKSNYLYLITENIWDEFYNTFSPYRNLLEKFTQEIIELDNMPEDQEYDEQDRINYLAANRAVETIMNTLFPEDNFDLGPVWEACALIRWIDSYEMGRCTFRDEGLILATSY